MTQANLWTSFMNDPLNVKIIRQKPNLDLNYSGNPIIGLVTSFNMNCGPLVKLLSFPE